MRSSLSAVVMLALAAGCGTDLAKPAPVPPGAPDDCATSYLDYQSFGAPFVDNWCRGCHSSELSAAQRAQAPLDVNFDTLDDVHHWRIAITQKAGPDSPTMPPAGGPSDDERALLAEWIGCGAP